MSLMRAPAKDYSRRRLAAALGVLAGLLLAVSAFLPYWQARLFAPQYRDGLTATMYLHRVAGDVDEIDNLNHYVGVAKLGSLARWERRLALPGLAALVLLCVTAFRRACPVPSGAKVAAVASFPLVFLADMKYWMHQASTVLDPTAPLKLKPFVIPLLGTGKVGQFRSEMGPMPGFYLALAAAALLLGGLWLIRSRRLSGGAGLAAALAFASLAPAASARPSLQPLLDRAVPGETLDLGSASYAGPAVIAKALTVKGSGALIDGGGRGTVLTVSAPGVVLEGLTLRGSGESLLAEDSGLKVSTAGVTARRLRLEDVLFGVFASNAAGFVLEDSVLVGKSLELGRRGDLVRVWNSDRVRLSGNRLEGGRDMVLWFSTGSVVERNEAFGGRYGLHFMYTNGARVTENVFRDNSVGLYVMYSSGLVLERNRFERHRGPSGVGLGLKESDSLTVRDNAFRDNRQAVFVDQSPLVATNRNLFEGNAFSYNDVGVALMPGVRGNAFTANSFIENLQQISVRGGGTLAGNDWAGNYWSDYAGYGREGRGTVPYRAERLVERLADSRPALRFFLYTPAAQALELAARTFPLFKPKPLMTDETPLLQAPARAGLPAGPRPALVLAALWLPVGLLPASAAALALGLRRRRLAAPVRASAAAAGPVVVGEELAKSFGGRTLFSGLSFSALPGECLVLWGSNGAGKSTLLRCLLGLESCTGALRVAGVDVSSDPAKARERVGYLSQEYAGYDWTVRQAMEFVCDVRGVPTAGISDVLARCGLAGEEAKAAPALSGGMKQKLALALALVGDPAILVLDEPTSSLDLKSRRELTAILSLLKGTRTIIMTSHHLDEVSALADRVLWLEADQPARMMRPAAFLSAVSREAAQ
ncbi:MAG: nitrous oxide reductase family maturation protein NosD [Elusimicrobia bacterium]|nr:nitrous oxide reductase family maturation protein NosD [Elusimicrobiota bacterium]